MDKIWPEFNRDVVELKDDLYPELSTYTITFSTMVRVKSENGIWYKIKVSQNYQTTKELLVTSRKEAVNLGVFEGFSNFIRTVAIAQSVYKINGNILDIHGNQVHKPDSDQTDEKDRLLELYGGAL